MSGKDTGPPTRSPYSGSASFLHSTPGGGEIHDLMQRSLRIKNTLFLFRTGIAMGRETKTGYKNEKLDRGRSIESGLDKVQDFAMEFYSDGQGTVRYEGLSVFNTEERGSYTGNILEEQSTMLSRITRFTGEETYSRIQEAVRTVLQEVYGSTYAGCIGVDMLVYKQKDGSFAIHPCIEINMRYTMGMVALRLFQQYVAPGAVGDYRVSYEKEAGEALEKHRLMSETYPLRLANGRIQEGYLSLCPVTKETHYRAYLLLM